MWSCRQFLQVVWEIKETGIDTEQLKGGLGGFIKVKEMRFDWAGWQICRVPRRHQQPARRRQTLKTTLQQAVRWITLWNPFPYNTTLKWPEKVKVDSEDFYRFIHSNVQVPHGSAPSGTSRVPRDDLQAARRPCVTLNSVAGTKCPG